jgi:hypothetical protein
MRNILENNIVKIYFKKIYNRHIFTYILFVSLFFVPFSGKVFADTTYVGGRISNDTTWTTSGSPYIVTSAISVYGDTVTPASLTINPGVELRFSSGTGLQIGSGGNKRECQGWNSCIRRDYNGR